MNSLSLMFRRNRRICSATHLSATRAKKRGKRGGGAAPVSDDIVNIFKDRSDPIILPSEYYPTWLFENLKEKFSPEEVLDHIKYGRYVPTGKEQWTFANNISRMRIRMNNDYGEHDRVYDSDEDWREPDDGEIAFIMKQEAKEAAALMDDEDVGEE